MKGMEYKKLEFHMAYKDIEEMCTNLKKEKVFCKTNRLRKMKG